MTLSSRVAGLDLGRDRDYSALAIVEHRTRTTTWDPVAFCHRTEHDLLIRRLRRFALGTSYHEVAALVIGELDAADPAALVVDATGVGAAVVEMLRDLPVPLQPVVLTAGEKAHYASSRLHVPKQDVVAVVASLLEQRRLRVSRRLEGASALADELRSFEARTGASGHVRYGARRSEAHDDLLMALALAAWYATGLWPNLLRSDLPPPPRHILCV